MCEGYWKDGGFDGLGTCTWADGHRYRGEWRNGMQYGQGTETDSNGNICREGQWINGIITSNTCIDDDLYDGEIAKLGNVFERYRLCH
jgi:hypothetical protein